MSIGQLCRHDDRWAAPSATFEHMHDIINGNLTKKNDTCRRCCSGKCASASPQQVTELKRRRFAESRNTFSPFLVTSRRLVDVNYRLAETQSAGVCRTRVSV